MKKPAIPIGLSKTAGRWFARLRDEYGIEDDGGLLVLEQAARQLDRAEAAAKLIAAEGVTIRDRWGQSKPHPACAIERDARSGVLAALRMLALDVEPVRPGPGRPPGR